MNEMLDEVKKICRELLEKKEVDAIVAWEKKDS